MSIINSLPEINTPGTYIIEGTFGAYPVGVASFSDVYMLGTGDKVSAPVNTPVYITSLADFNNVFGLSPSSNAIALFLAQRPGKGLRFINVERKSTRSITIPSPGVGTYTLTIDGYLISVTGVVGDTQATIITKLAAQVNSKASHLATIRNGILRLKPSLTVAASSNITLGTATTATNVTVADVQDALLQGLEPDMPAGFLIAPQIFQSLTLAADHTALASAMESHCSDPSFNWLAIADCLPSTATSQTGAGFVNSALAEVATLSSPKGHLCYYFPYLVDLNNNLVPASTVVAGVALRRYRQEGFRQPPAGVSFPIYGTKGTTVKVTALHQEVLNPANVNCIRTLPGRGTVVYGARTVSIDSNYRYLTTRVILNVLANTHRTAFDSLLFSSVDGLGVLFSRIKQTSVAICERLRLAGALFGANPDEAYKVICDNTNNLGSDLDAGRVTLDVLVKPSPMAEVILVRLFRASLGSPLNEQAESSQTIQQDSSNPA